MFNDRHSIFDVQSTHIITPMQFAIGIDLGGTRIKGTALDAEGHMLHKLYTPTYDGDGAVWKNAVAETVNELLKNINGHDSVIGISAPGLPSLDHASIAY